MSAVRVPRGPAPLGGTASGEFEPFSLVLNDERTALVVTGQYERCARDHRRALLGVRVPVEVPPWFVDEQLERFHLELRVGESHLLGDCFEEYVSHLLPGAS